MSVLISCHANSRLILIYLVVVDRVKKFFDGFTIEFLLPVGQVIYVFMTLVVPSDWYN